MTASSRGTWQRSGFRGNYFDCPHACSYAAAIAAFASSRLSAIPLFGGGAPVIWRNHIHFSPPGNCFL